MIDIHMHILPGVDDGAADWDSALRMARIAVDCGVTAVAATPHCNMHYPNFDGAPLRRIRAHLEELLKTAHINLKLLSGMEIMGSMDTAEELQRGHLCTLNGSHYPLVEFHFHGSGQEETEILESLIQCGYQPVVAHPERYIYVQRDPELLNTWVELGCLLQVNRGSLLGRFGREAAAMAYAMLERRFVAVVASDAHSPIQRTPYLADVWELLEQEAMPKTAKLLLEENPRRILRDQKVTMPVPDWF